MEISSSIKYIGVNDRVVDLFEGQYPVPEGISYNSYVILDEKIAVLDTMDTKFTSQWIKNLESVLDGRKPDYLVVHHMEPDHSASITDFVKAYPDAKIVASSKAFAMMKQFFDSDFLDKQITVGEGSTLELGAHTLTFLTAPMVHWPEVIVSYDSLDRVLFSADGFGKFGDLDTLDNWDDEARRYYIGIVGKYGAQVQALLKKASAFDIRMICPLHGPVLKENLDHYLSLYNIWSSYTPESDGIVIAYTSVYGNTKKAAMLLKEKLLEKGCKNVAVYDLARSDKYLVISEAFRYSKLVLATTTYNNGMFPFMQEFIHGLIERGFKNRKVALIENGSWAPVTAKLMGEALGACKNITFCENSVKILSALNGESLACLEALANELCAE